MREMCECESKFPTKYVLESVNYDAFSSEFNTVFSVFAIAPRCFLLKVSFVVFSRALKASRIGQSLAYIPETSNRFAP